MKRIKRSLDRSYINQFFNKIKEYIYKKRLYYIIIEIYLKKKHFDLFKLFY